MRARLRRWWHCSLPRPRPRPLRCCCAWSTRCCPRCARLWSPLLWVVAVLSMTVGNLAALRQENVKRMLAYSSIAHAGYLLAAFAGVGNSGIAAASFYIAAYAAMNVGIFAVITLVSGYDDKLPLVEDFRGLIYRSPLLGSLLIFFLVSLVGIPFYRFGRLTNCAGRIDGALGNRDLCAKTSQREICVLDAVDDLLVLAVESKVGCQQVLLGRVHRTAPTTEIEEQPTQTHYG